MKEIMEVYIKLTTNYDPKYEKMLVRDILKVARDIVEEGRSHRQMDQYFNNHFEVSATTLRGLVTQRPTYTFDTDGHTVVEGDSAKKKHPFVISEKPSIDERYFYWYFTEGPLWELPIKLVLLIPTLILILVIGLATGGPK